MPMLSVKQASTVLSVAPATVYALVSQGRIKAHRFGLRRGTIRISEEALRDYQEAAQIEPKRFDVQLKHIKLSD
jgi:excisionase family DNA binding protein